ncbi:family 78 glycoside hydrolase catalytic domain [Paenibacillus sp. strain BS8-2]
MRSWEADWVWIDDAAQPINTYVCFRRVFSINKYNIIKAVLSISADTSFHVWINGVELGSGPIRSSSDHWYYEQYIIPHLLIDGNNTIAAIVSHSGHSTYSYIENRSGLLAELHLEMIDGTAHVIASDERWKAHLHTGYMQHVVKRNVNIGWLEVYDARKWGASWLDSEYDDSDWTAAKHVCRGGEGAWGTLYPRTIEPFAKKVIQPRKVMAHSEVRPIQKVLSLNLRENFFPDHRDANVKIFTGYFASAVQVEKDTTGRMSFAHTPWNGLQGRFKIDDQWYKSGDSIELKQGRHLFLVEIAGLHNDVISHMEWDFEEEITFVHPLNRDSDSRSSAFVTFGPYQTIEAIADGYHPLFGGVDKNNGLNKEEAAFVEVGKVNTLEDFLYYEGIAKNVDNVYVMENLMIYSLMLRKQTLAAYTINRELDRMLFDHDRPASIPVPLYGGDQELIIDLGKLYVGQVIIELEAQEGTVIDVYGFEAVVKGEVRYTSGVNNAFRYYAREGRQSYKCLSRMGFRYLMVTIREQRAPVLVYKIAVEQSGYPVNDYIGFRCSDPMLNDIWEISRHTSEVCTEDTFVDCPTYERVFWVGDCRVSALVNYYIYGTYELVKHSLELVPRSRDQSKLLLACLPTDWQVVIPMWTFSWVIACKEYIAYSADRSFANHIYPQLAQVLEHYCQFINEDHLFDISAWNLVDWADLDIPSVGIGTAQHAGLAYCCQVASEIAETVGKYEDVSKWNTITKNLRAALGEHLWDQDKQAYVDGKYRSGEYSKTFSQQTHILLYLFDAIDRERLALTEGRLIHAPADWVPIVSPFMSFYLFEVWVELGRLDLVLDRIREVWGGMVHQGSTTAWETYPNTRSFAHAWSAAPAYVMGKYLLGITRLEEGFKAIKLNPPSTDLMWAEGSVPTPFGRMDVQWNKENDHKWIELRLPQEIEVSDADARADGWEIRITRLQRVR